MSTNKEKIKQDFGSRLKELLKSNGIQNKDLAISLKVQQTSVSAWITGKSEPTLSNIWAILEFFEEINKSPKDTNSNVNPKNVNALKALFPDFFKSAMISRDEEIKEQLNKAIKRLTRLRNEV